MALDLQGCRTLVTGGSSGIGAGLAEALAERGAIVGICGRRDELLSEVIGRCMKHSPDSRMWVANLADPDAVDKLAVDVLDAFGGIDLLVNNAGVTRDGLLARMSEADWDTVIQTNLSSCFHWTKAIGWPRRIVVPSATPGA